VVKNLTNKELSVERTLIIIKPDAVQRGLTGQIIHRFERRGLRIAALKFMQIDQALARRHYAVHEGKPFYEPLVDYITSGPVVVMILQGKDAIQIARRTMGATNPAQADPGTIRADFAVEVGRNLVHGSDGAETAAFETALFFQEDEILSWERSLERWISE
jgi:nucleoside-diphosphate kinase